jgi:hypothetical protein
MVHVRGNCVLRHGSGETCVETAHINSGPSQSQFNSRHMLGNGRINTFPQQRGYTHFNGNNTHIHGSSSTEALETKTGARCLLHGPGYRYSKLTQLTT